MKRQFSLEAVYAFIFAICVLVALLLLAGCGHANEAAAEDKPEVHGQSVVFPAGSTAAQRLAVEKVEPPVAHEVVIPGRLAWDEERTVRVFTPFAGRVTRIVANVGDHVRAGQALAEMLSPDFGQAQADARKAEADLLVATKSLERQRDLAAHGVAAAKDLQQAQADHSRAQAEYDRARGRLSAYANAAGSESRFVLAAAVAGTIVERNINPGQELRPDQPDKPQFVITDPTHLWVNLDASESDLRYLKRGQYIVVTSNQFPDDSFAGTLRQVADFVDPTTRTIKVRGEVPNANRALKAEMFVSAHLQVPAGEEPSVNARAVYLEGARRFAFVRTDASTFIRRPVKVGPEYDGRMPVVAGLQAGEEVVTGGNLYLQQILASAPQESREKTARQP